MAITRTNDSNKSWQLRVITLYLFSLCSRVPFCAVILGVCLVFIFAQSFWAFVSRSFFAQSFGRVSCVHSAQSVGWFLRSFLRNRSSVCFAFILRSRSGVSCVHFCAVTRMVLSRTVLHNRSGVFFRMNFLRSRSGVFLAFTFAQSFRSFSRVHFGAVVRALLLRSFLRSHFRRLFRVNFCAVVVFFFFVRVYSAQSLGRFSLFSFCICVLPAIAFLSLSLPSSPPLSLSLFHLPTYISICLSAFNHFRN